MTTHPGGAVQSRALAASRTTTALTSRPTPPVAATSCSRRRSRISTMPPPTVPPPTMPTLRTCAASGAPRADAAGAAGANARPRAHHDATRTPRTIISVDFREGVSGAPRKYGLLCVALDCGVARGRIAPRLTSCRESAVPTVGTVPQVRYRTAGTVFTSPILSGYLTRISETRIVKLR